jgi:hypothetical protein
MIELGERARNPIELGALVAAIPRLDRSHGVVAGDPVLEVERNTLVLQLGALCQLGALREALLDELERTLRRLEIVGEQQADARYLVIGPTLGAARVEMAFEQLSGTIHVPERMGLGEFEDRTRQTQRQGGVRVDRLGEDEVAAFGLIDTVSELLAAQPTDVEV